MENGITWAGFDVHKRTIVVALKAPGRPVEQFEIENCERAVEKLARKLEREARGGEIRCCYEAGACGYVLQRQMQRAGSIVCEVIAPSLIPAKPGERVKTDKRDAKKLLELYQANLLTPVRTPTEAEESMRDLVRCREDAREDLNRARHRLLKFLLRHGFVFDGQHWTKKHVLWIRGVRLADATGQDALNDYLLAFDQVTQRVEALEERLEAAAQLPLYRDVVAALRCFRGFNTLNAMIFACELHGFERFTNPRALAAYLGLTPSEHSSGGSQRRGAITKTGNGYVRRALVQASWQYRHRPRATGVLAERRKGQPPAVIAIADKAQHRLHQRFTHLVSKGKTPNKALIAISRELVGFLWAALKSQSERKD